MSTDGLDINRRATVVQIGTTVATVRVYLNVHAFFYPKMLRNSEFPKFGEEMILNAAPPVISQPTSELIKSVASVVWYMFDRTL